MRTRKRSGTQELQSIVQMYRDRTGTTDVDMNEVAAWAIRDLGVKVKPAKTEAERLAQNLSRAARQETRRDPVTNRPYRVNHAYTAYRSGEQTTLWTDIDKAPREPMQMSFQHRREQMVGDGYHLSLDVEHWNSVNPYEEPINVLYDLTNDIDERRAAAAIEEEIEDGDADDDDADND